MGAVSPARATRPIPFDQEPHAGPPLPFPFLTLCWRIGLGGQWVRRSCGTADLLTAALIADPSALAGRSCRESRRLYRTGMARLLACRDEARNHCVGPMNGRVGTAGHLNDSDPLWDPLWRCLQRSHLARRVSAMDPPAAQRAAAATLRLLIAAPRPAGTRSFPPLWGRLARAVVRGPGRVYIPRPRARYDPLAWTLLRRLLDQWEVEGLTFVGRQRRQLYLRAGSRRMARTYAVSRRRALACGRAAHRVWRHWYETLEGPREARLRALPLPPALQRTVGDPARVYRAIRKGRRTGQPTRYAGLLPAALTRLFLDEADQSIASFPREPTTPEWPRDPIPFLARALRISPLVAAARTAGLSEPEIRPLTAALASAVLTLLTAPWPWTRRRCPS